MRCHPCIGHRSLRVTSMIVKLLGHAADSVVSKAHLKKARAGAVADAYSPSCLWHPRTKSADGYGMELSLPGEPVVPQPASVRGIGAVLAGHVDSVLSLPTEKYVEPYCSTFSHAPRDHARVVPGNRWLVDEDVLLGVVALTEAIPFLT